MGGGGGGSSAEGPQASPSLAPQHQDPAHSLCPRLTHWARSFCSFNSRVSVWTWFCRNFS